MQVTVSGKQIEIGAAFQGYAEGHLEAVVGKYFDRGIDAAVTVSRAGQSMRVDIKVHAGRGFVIQSHGEAEQTQQAFDIALERAGKRLRRYKRRLKGHHRKERAQAKLAPLNVQRYVIAPPDEDDDESANQDAGAAVIAEVTREIETLSVGDAVMRLDLADRAALMFRNAANGQLNVVYRRRDGNIGWIDPQPT